MFKKWFEARRLKKEQEIVLTRKTRVEEEVVIQKVRAEICLIDKKIETYNNELFLKKSDEAKVRNLVCPKCGHKNVIDILKRQQTSINGSFSSHSWNALSFGESNSHGSIIGQSDTNEVNTCKDCGNEWKKHKNEWHDYRIKLRHKIDNVEQLLLKAYELQNIKYDSLDVKEKYNSLTEKKQGLQSEFDNDWKLRDTKSFFEGISIRTLFELCKREERFSRDKFKKYFTVQNLLLIGFTK